ncbi:hypothetical protein Q6350_06025 [Isoptericola sp. b515]|uniref:hypothetical protein n=1 Tax=Isoptericola sp. b515 TaxID=3064652 RepID=UPI00271446AA|nr:hypothetical protein [Isoptericola sp. b515]MDO8147984.1 hypothetical protein [Isoptericola sp. b515]
MSALVESPLQLLCAVEAHAAGIAGRRTRVLARQGVPTLTAAVDAFRDLGLPDGLDVVVTRPRPAPEDDVHLVGDPFSGTFQAALARGAAGGRLVLVDDGLATLDLARRLLAGDPLVRPTAHHGPLRRGLGAVTTRRLRRLARDGRLTVWTMLPLDRGLTDGLRALGVDVREHSFDWLASRDRGSGPADVLEEPTVVVGSALAADHLVDVEHYVAWVRGIAADGPVRYLPHRRHHPLVTALLAQIPGVGVTMPGAPVEVRLRNLRGPRRVITLPSTAAITLTRLLSPRGVAVVPHDVPDDWWTARADPALRNHLGAATALARSAARRTRRPQPATT